MHLLDQPHHDGSPLYVSNGAPKLDELVTVRVRVPAGVTDVHVRVVVDGEPIFVPSSVDGDGWRRATIRAHNPVTRYRFYVQRADAPPVWLTAAGVVKHDVPDSTDFRLVAHEAPPQWAGDAIVYEVFPDRFGKTSEKDAPDWAIPCDWDDDEVEYDTPATPLQFFGGDLDGITEHLDHIEALGANTIYLRPVFPARSNHRYNATTFDRVDPLLGGDAALQRLSDAVHARGMRLIGDITTNHCGDDHEWFVKARALHKEREMFYFDADGGYEAWYGVPSLPKLNWGSALVRQRMTDVMLRWLDVYDGWRVDVANMTGRFGADDHNAFVQRELRRAIAEKRPDALLLAEHTHDSTGDLDTGGWQGTMNQAGFTRPVWAWLRGDECDLPNFIGVPGGVPRRTGGQVVAAMRRFAAQMSWSALTHSWQLLDSFDTARFRTVCGSQERHLVGFGLLATLPGTPMVCAGSEWGLTGNVGEHARTPMPWERPSDRDDEMFEACQRLLRLRSAEPALRHGSLRWAFVGDDALVFLRETADGGSLLVSATRADTEPIALALSGPLTGVYEASDLDGDIVLPGDGPAFRVWRL
ncbi:glycoside hydrolase family 13 protein [Allorhizocola rhizosphaerae]|uniref:glycoside hydrolase family 13 protein n=1 Tax=Allorhizocola rhizosphaerae TaxID=1872709 RepID=UPI0014790B1D|nr:glycoside hydrolase family 13 protein [Allorhizocola rhizosphaerae]